MTELGSGISRGCMDLGRLYQGKYVPPDRCDGLITEPENVEDIEDMNSKMINNKIGICKIVTEKDVISDMVTEKNVSDSDQTYIDLD